MLDFIRIACAVPDVAVANVKHNTEEICKYIAQADEQGVDLLVFPELALTGASCMDLFFEDALYTAVKKGLRTVAECSRDHSELTVVVGFPLRLGMQVFNCAAVLYDGCVAGITAKLINPAYMADFGRKWYVLFFYVLNFVMVSVDFCLYFRNRRLDRERGEV